MRLDFGLSTDFILNSFHTRIAEMVKDELPLSLKRLNCMICGQDEHGATGGP